MARFAALDGREKKLPLFQNISAQNFRGTMFERKRFLADGTEGNESCGRMLRQKGRHFPDQARNFRLVRISDNPGDAAERGKFFRGPLGVAARDNDSRRWIAPVNGIDRLPPLQTPAHRHHTPIPYYHTSSTPPPQRAPPPP